MMTLDNSKVQFQLKNIRLEGFANKVNPLSGPKATSGSSKSVSKTETYYETIQKNVESGKGYFARAKDTQPLACHN